jgi:hypothetical protein
MAGAVADAKVRISADDRAVKPSLDKTQSDMGAFASNVKRILAGITIAYLTRQVYDFGASAIAAYEEQANAEKLLDRVLKSTGETAGRTKEQLVGLADSLEEATNVAGDLIVNAEKVLLTFTNIKGDVFDSAIKSALDMNAVLGGDLQSSALQLGKALNDPVAGISALSRSGVSFTESQKELIKIYQESGRLAEAQGVILDELAKEFGGASIKGDTFSDKLGTVAVKSDQMKEAIGGMLAGGLVPFTPAMDGAVNSAGAIIAPAMGATLALLELANGLLAAGDAAGAGSLSTEDFANQVSIWSTGWSTAIGSWQGLIDAYQLGIVEAFNATQEFFLGPNLPGSPMENLLKGLREDVATSAEDIEQSKIDQRKAAEAQAKLDQEQRKKEMEEAAEDRRKKAVLEEGIVSEARLKEIGLKEAEEETKRAIAAKARKQNEGERQAWAGMKLQADQHEKKQADAKLAEEKAKEAAEQRLRDSNQLAEEKANEAAEAEEKRHQDYIGSLGRDGLAALHDRIQDAALKKTQRNIVFGASNTEDEAKAAAELAAISARTTRDAITRQNKEGVAFAPEDSPEGQHAIDAARAMDNYSRLTTNNPTPKSKPSFLAEYGNNTLGQGIDGANTTNVKVETKQADVVTAINTLTEVVKDTKPKTKLGG